MRRLSTLIVAALTCGLALVSPASLAAQTPDATAPAASDTRIAFTHCAARCQIFTANPDGSSIHRVTHGVLGDAYEPDWAPDGTRIAFASNETGRSEIWIVRADGANPRRLTLVGRGHAAFWPAFSSNGRWVIYTDCAGFDCDGGISIVRVDGTHQGSITPNSGTSFNDATMSLDGSSLAYQRWHLDGVTSAVYVSNVDGSDERRLTPPRLLAYAPDWRPDGERVAFASDLYGDRPFGSIYTIAADGTDVVRVTNPPYPSSDTGPSYSPDGARILFESTRSYPDGCCASLFIVNADGTDLAAVPLPWDAYEPSWGTAPAFAAAAA
jgi:TolB protein